MIHESTRFSLQSDDDILKLMKQLDPNSNGRIGFDVFVDYMTRELTDMDTSDQLLQSFRTISGDKVGGVGGCVV